MSPSDAKPSDARQSDALIDRPKPTRSGEELDREALATWLRARPELGLLDASQGPEAIVVEQFPSGYSNLTYLLAIAGREVVLRRPPFGNTVKSGHDMGREVDVLSKLAPVYALAPRPLATCDDPSVLGAPFYIMERRRGVIIRRRLPKGVELEADRARALSTSLIDGLAQLHAIDWQAIGLGELGRPAGYARRQVEGWTRRWQAAQTDALPRLDAVATWLAAELPADADDHPALIHNDYKYDNVVLDPEGLRAGGEPRITAVLDWEMATIGSPRMDLGTTLGYWVEAGDDARLQGLAFGPTNLPGSLTRRELVDRYMARTGHQVTAPEVYRVFGVFKIAVIIQQIYARYRKGSTQDPRFAALGAFVSVLAEVADDAASRRQL